ncbi:ARMADILLO-TYPE FOLD PROTEIN-RELATED [Salix koriyanagi]|uniref:ARMADILLO-TYPE FOLD PROTEIN-RELATED n=1 Tax=Salix koriyanagi TaxID=2511006 RepID=A0A9Q0VB02_9ROSI|nr:ARMADILLO-TYPE FOLD PROTEIN-RELATED [Salix koriyanagi]
MEAAMEQSKNDLDSHSLLEFLEALKKASKDMQTNPIFITNDPQPSMESILNLESEVDTILSSDPNFFKLSQLLCSLKTLSEKLRRFQEHSLKSFFSRQITKTLEEVADIEEEKVRVLKRFERRLSQGFDRDFQEVVLRGKVFAILESILCDSTRSTRVREHVAHTVVALVRFNRDVFVGMVLMSGIVQALIPMASCCSRQVVCSLVTLIRTPLIDEMGLRGEIPRIVSLFCSSEDLSIEVGTMDCICQIAYFGRMEVVESMLEKGLIEKLVELQRSTNGDNLIETHQSKEREMAVVGEEGERSGMEIDEIERDLPFAGCVARFSVQVEVGEGLGPAEKKEIKVEILRRIGEASVSEAEAATIIAEVLWGSSP